MTRTRLILLLFGGILILTGFVVGRVTSPTRSSDFSLESLGVFTSIDAAPDDPAQPLPTQLTSESVLTTTTPLIPDIDVPGADIPGLSRFPDARRVEYRQRVQDDLIVTEVEYVTTADFQSVHNFYRNVFSTEGWLVADLTFYQGEWTFLVVSGDREALVEVESRGPIVEVEIEFSEPQNNPILIPATVEPLQSTGTAESSEVDGDDATTGDDSADDGNGDDRIEGDDNAGNIDSGGNTAAVGDDDGQDDRIEGNDNAGSNDTDGGSANGGGNDDGGDDEDDGPNDDSSSGSVGNTGGDDDDDDDDGDDDGGDDGDDDDGDNDDDDDDDGGDDGDDDDDDD